MVFDSRLNQLRSHFGITRPEDWRDVSPSWITELPGFGPGILSYIRLELAAKGITLRDDKTAEFWKQHLANTHITQAMGDPEDEENEERHTIAPFTVLIDSAEQTPFTFTGLKDDTSDGGRPLIVPTEWRCLGRHPDSQGDYSISGYVGRVAIERKSMADAQSTILGWSGGRERFESELGNLSRMNEAGGAAVVIVESSFQALITNAPEHGKRSKAQNAKALHRSVIAYQQDYRVGWLFCDGRRLAETTAYQFLARFWRKREEERKEERKAEKKAEKLAAIQAAANTSNEHPLFPTTEATHAV